MHPAIIGCDNHVERRIGPILRGGVGSGQGQHPSGRGQHRKVRMRKVMTVGVLPEVSEDQKREKTAALARRLTRILDPDFGHQGGNQEHPGDRG